ncbi:Na(+)/H(+) antiporter subunit A [Corynebacterium caspium DSM 44850]|nr:Na(+)/H(+) antiporter subunit A [Corynebacterium caspium DSM 44850]
MGIAVAAAVPLVRLIDRAAGWILAAILVAAALPLAKELPRIISGEPISWSATWIPDFLGSGVDISLALRADALSAFFSLLALLIGAVVFAYSAAYLPPKDGNSSFYLIMTAFTLAVVLLVLADDAFVLFIGWELVSMASFLLIARSPGSAGEKGSQRTLVLTFIGGLLLLAGLAIAVTVTGTTNLTEILASTAWSAQPKLTIAVALLVALSAFTKAAQFPFHFWLPEAMAAATPVSAFLHAAAVVKAGIYVLLRFSAVFATVPAWNWLLIVVGMSTAVMSALFALTKTDLKKLTAYSTVSHLGWIVATIGIGTPVALAAAAVHTLAHALFKSSLFMLIGVIDHENGTRDTRRLGVIWKKMPFTFTATVIAALSMAAVPPLFGFLSKEGMLGAFMAAPIGNAGVVLLLTAAGIGALLTFTYSAKLVFGAFIDGRETPLPADVTPKQVHEAPLALWLPAALPGLFSIPLGLAPFVLSGLMDGIVHAILPQAEHHTHLSLWHGINTPLLISVAVLVLGILGVSQRAKIWPVLENRRFMISGNELLYKFQDMLTKFGRILGSPADSLNPSRHMAPPVLMVILLGLVTLFGTSGIDGVALAPRTPGLDNWLDLVPFLIVTISVIGMMWNRHRLTGAVLIGTVGVGITFQMLILGAPDVALTQFLVEALVVVIMMLVLRYQPAYFPAMKAAENWRALIIAVLAGITAFLGVFTLLGRRDRSELAEWFIANAPEISGGQNIVATIIVEFRALDTLGELSVLGMAAIVIISVVGSIPRLPMRAQIRKRPFGQSMLNSVPLKKAFILVAPVLGILSVAIFYRGHQDPGGGFVAALIAGAALMLAYLAKGRDSIVFKPATAVWLTGIGIVVALIPGFLGLLHGSFLYPIHFHFLGQHLSSSLVFDGGIYLAVVGMLTQAVNSLGGYLLPGAPTVRMVPHYRAGMDVPLIDATCIPATEAFPEPLEPSPLGTKRNIRPLDWRTKANALYTATFATADSPATTDQNKEK